MTRGSKRVAETEPDLFSEGYWKRREPKLTDRGSQSEEDIFKAVGYALSQWEQTEEAFTELFMVMTEIASIRSYTIVSRVYGGIEHSAGRRTALRAAGEIFFIRRPDLDKPRFDGLLTSFDRASGRRDDIAHGKALSLTVDGADMGSFLVPAGYNSRRNVPFAGLSATNPEDDPLWFMRGRYRYTESEILDFAGKFRELGKRVLQYEQTLAKETALPERLIEELRRLDAEHTRGQQSPES